MIRAVVKVHEKYKSDRRFGIWDILDDKAFMKTLGAGFVDPRSLDRPFQQTMLAEQFTKRVLEEDNDERCFVEASSQ